MRDFRELCFELVHFGFTPDDVLALDMEQFDEAIELLNNVHMRHRREELLRINVATQGDEKAIKKFLAGYTRRDEAPVGARDQTDFVAFAGGYQ